MSLTFELVTPISRLDVIAQAFGAAAYVTGGAHHDVTLANARVTDRAAEHWTWDQFEHNFNRALRAICPREGTTVDEAFIAHVYDVATTYIKENYEFQEVPTDVG